MALKNGVSSRCRKRVAPFVVSGNHSQEQPMTTEASVKGPASYFPSIEKKYGQPSITG